MGPWRAHGLRYLLNPASRSYATYASLTPTVEIVRWLKKLFTDKY